MTDKFLGQKYKVHFRFSDRWSAPEEWDQYFDTKEEAQKAINETNAKNISLNAPDEYTVAYKEVLVNRYEKLTTYDEPVRVKK